MRCASALLPWFLLALGRGCASEVSSFQYERPIFTTGTGQTCAVVDPAIFAHAAPALRDLRIYADRPAATEVPYLLTVSEAQQMEAESARVFNIVRVPRGGVSFDLAMPSRPYTDVVLDLAAHDFVASADVSGERAATVGKEAGLGQFTLFDLSKRHLARSTVLRLQESTFPVLRVRLHLWDERTGRPILLDTKSASQLVRSASVPPSRERQTLFDTALVAPAQTTGRESVAHFTLPQHVPIERVLVRLAPGFAGNISREIRVSARPVGADTGEVVTGTISHVHVSEAGLAVNLQQMTVDATIGANLQGPADVQVVIENGSDAPLPIVAIALEARRRSLCFHNGTVPLTLFYGDPDLQAAGLSDNPSVLPALAGTTAKLGPETTNPAWQPRVRKSVARRQEPRHILWMVLLGLAVLLGVVAARSTRVVRH